MKARKMRESSSILLHCIAGALVATLLTGCTVGPDFRRPAGPGIAAYTASPLPERTTSAPGALENPSASLREPPSKCSGGAIWERQSSTP